MRPLFILALALLTLALVASPRVTHAQEAGPGQADAPPTTATAPTPPRLTRFVEAVYPAGVSEAAEVTVTLRLTIGVDGRVREAEVTTPVGRGFDEAALAAAREFVFEPATRNGAPVAARVSYAYVFRPPAPPPPEPEVEVAPAAPPRGSIEGSVRVRGEDQPVPNAEIVLVAEGDGSTLRIVASPLGAFPETSLPAGAYRATLSADGYELSTTRLEVEADVIKSVVFELDPSSDVDSFSATATIDPPPREVTRRTIGREELTRVAGTRGDALRAIEILPGVARPPFGAGALIVRGSSPDDTQTFLEGVPVPSLYHFGGLTSFMNSRLLDRIDFYPGNFSARFGRKIGGIIDIGVREPSREGVAGVVDINLIDASILVEAPIGSRASFALAARRSYIDFFFREVVPDDAFSIVAAPVYYDYQGVLVWRPTSADRLRLMVLGSSDRFELIFADPQDADPNVRGNLDLSNAFHRVQANWRRRLSRSVDQEIEISAGPQDFRIALGESFNLDIGGINYGARAEWRARLARNVRLIVGTDLVAQPFDVKYVGPQPTQQEGNPGAMTDPLRAENERAVDTSVNVYRPGFYVETDLRPFDDLRIVAGLRLDYASEISAWAYDPRVVVRYELGERTTLKGGVGLFSQPPEFQESNADIGNPDLDHLQALHLGLGVDHRFDDVYSLGVDGFFKSIWNGVTSTESSLAPFFTNDGRGRIYGLEIAARAKPKGRFFGFLSYTLSRSERSDRGGPWRLFDFDQTHILTVSATYRLGRGWELGGTFRLVSGNPETPITGALYDASLDLYRPLFGATNSSRNPVYHRLDVRIEKLWRFDHWKLALYLDIQNAYNQTNREGTAYSFDYSQSADIGGLPIIPSLGIRGEL